MLGAWAVDYRTSLADLAAMGALTGLILGPAQAVPPGPRCTPLGLGGRLLGIVGAGLHRVTTPAGIHVEEQFTIVGVSGALTFSALSGAA